jgi:hypothetical protein
MYLEEEEDRAKFMYIEQMIRAGGRRIHRKTKQK